jgi:hypothetical protein
MACRCGEIVWEDADKRVNLPQGRSRGGGDGTAEIAREGAIRNDNIRAACPVRLAFREHTVADDAHRLLNLPSSKRSGAPCHRIIRMRKTQKEYAKTRVCAQVFIFLVSCTGVECTVLVLYGVHDCGS